MSNPKQWKPVDETHLRSETFVLAEEPPTPTPRLDPLIGKTVTNFKINELMGRGAMGSVYKARHMVLDKDVAIKLLHSHLCTDEQAIKRFRQEATSASRLEHPGIVRVQDFGVTVEGQPYLQMDFVHGTSLSHLIAQGPLQADRALKLCAQVCSALTEAHNKGVVHRDIKPSNLILTNPGQADEAIKVVDFGIAKLMEEVKGGLTQTGEAMGSPPYMSPEQCAAGQLDARSDVYSLGCVLFEMLTGHPPFPSESMYEVVHHHLHTLPASTGVLSLDAVILKAMAKDPAKRYASAKEFETALEESRLTLASKQSIKQKVGAYLKVMGARQQPKKLLILASTILLLGVCGTFAAKYFIEAPKSNVAAIAIQKGPVDETAFARARHAGAQYAKQGKWQESFDSYTEAMTLGAPFGKENPKVQECMFGIGQSLMKLGEKKNGEAMMTELAKVQKFAGDQATILDNASAIARLTNEHAQHPTDGKIKTNLMKILAAQAKLYVAVAQYKEAISCGESVVSIADMNSELDFPYVITALYAVSHAQADELGVTRQQSLISSKQTADKMLNLCMKFKASENSVELAQTYLAFGRYFYECEVRAMRNRHSVLPDAARAMGFYRKAEKIIWELYGDSSPMMADCLTEKAAVIYVANNLGDNEQLIESAIKMNEDYRGLFDPRTARGYVGLALHKIRAVGEKRVVGAAADRQVQDAKQLLEKADVVFRGTAASDSESVILLDAYRGWIYAYLKDDSAAEEYLGRAFGRATRMDLEYDSGLFAYEQLLQIYTRQGRQSDIDALNEQAHQKRTRRSVVTDS
jgi:tRNA A-37 threonylcarbamoyl transferase component Bud32/tetratricopeptide (TPR) repeat protein